MNTSTITNYANVTNVAYAVALYDTVMATFGIQSNSKWHHCHPIYILISLRTGMPATSSVLSLAAAGLLLCYGLTWRRNLEIPRPNFLPCEFWQLENFGDCSA